jgi:DNA-binding MarR family transcriptional regulator
MLKSTKLGELEKKYLNRLLRTLVIVVHRSNEHKFVSLKELRETLKRNCTNLSNILKILERDNLLKRTSTRPKQVYATKLGKQLLKRIEDIFFNQ